MRLTALLSMAVRVVKPKDYRFGTNRPWMVAAKRLNPPGKKRRKVFVEPLAPEEWSVLRGDMVRNSHNTVQSGASRSGPWMLIINMTQHVEVYSLQRPYN